MPTYLETLNHHVSLQQLISAAPTPGPCSIPTLFRIFPRRRRGLRVIAVSDATYTVTSKNSYRENKNHGTGAEGRLPSRLRPIDRHWSIHILHRHGQQIRTAIRVAYWTERCICDTTMAVTNKTLTHAGTHTRKHWGSVLATNHALEHENACTDLRITVCCNFLITLTLPIQPPSVDHTASTQAQTAGKKS